MKYKLINVQTQEEHYCEKITINGFDYYISNENAVGSRYGLSKMGLILEIQVGYDATLYRKIVATNNPTAYDIPKVMSQCIPLQVLNELCDEKDDIHPLDTFDICSYKDGVEDGYNKAKELFQFSEHDMINFACWIDDMGYTQVSNEFFKSINNEKGKTAKELFLIWQEQRPITLQIR